MGHTYYSLLLAKAAFEKGYLTEPEYYAMWRLVFLSNTVTFRLARKNFTEKLTYRAVVGLRNWIRNIALEKLQLSNEIFCWTDHPIGWLLYWTGLTPTMLWALITAIITLFLLQVFFCFAIVFCAFIAWVIVNIRIRLPRYSRLVETNGKPAKTAETV